MERQRRFPAVTPAGLPARVAGVAAPGVDRPQRRRPHRAPLTGLIAAGYNRTMLRRSVPRRSRSWEHPAAARHSPLSNRTGGATYVANLGLSVQPSAVTLRAGRSPKSSSRRLILNSSISSAAPGARGPFGSDGGAGGIAPRSTSSRSASNQISISSPRGRCRACQISLARRVIAS